MKEQTWQQWIRGVILDKKDRPQHPSKLFKGCTAGLTGTDVRVLDAFVACLKLYSQTDDTHLFPAISVILRRMQSKERWIARELIPFVMNWEDRERLWYRLCPDEQERLGALGRSYGRERETYDEGDYDEGHGP